MNVVYESEVSYIFINVLFGKRLHSFGEIPYPCTTLPSRYLSLIKIPNRSGKYSRRKSNIKFKQIKINCTVEPLLYDHPQNHVVVVVSEGWSLVMDS